MNIRFAGLNHRLTFCSLSVLILSSTFSQLRTWLQFCTLDVLNVCDLSLCSQLFHAAPHSVQTFYLFCHLFCQNSAHLYLLCLPYLTHLWIIFHLVLPSQSSFTSVTLSLLLSAFRHSPSLFHPLLITHSATFFSDTCCLSSHIQAANTISRDGIMFEYLQ